MAAGFQAINGEYRHFTLLRWSLDSAYVKAYVLTSTEGVSMDTISASDARARLYNLIDETAASHVPITITGKRNNAVLVSAEDWTAIQETLYLLSVPGMRESIMAAREEPLDGSDKELIW
jgi:prevent-host-death family protein